MLVGLLIGGRISLDIPSTNLPMNGKCEWLERLSGSTGLVIRQRRPERGQGELSTDASAVSWPSKGTLWNDLWWLFSVLFWVMTFNVATGQILHIFQHTLQPSHCITTAQLAWRGDTRWEVLEPGATLFATRCMQPFLSLGDWFAGGQMESPRDRQK